MVLPLMSCGARLPIYALLIPAFFAEKYQPMMLWGIYIIGVIVAMFGAWLMRNTLFKGDGEIYLMELPPYRMPMLKSLMLHMWDRGKMYVEKAGTVILAAAVILYICNTLPVKKNFDQDYDAKIAQTEKIADAEERETQLQNIENERQAECKEYTISGRIGKFLAPVFKPIGFDWKATTASIGALAAKEVFVAQLGVLYSEGEADENSSGLREKLIKHYSPLQAFCIMLYCLLSIPCLATLAVIKRETNSWKMAVAEACGLFVLAYVATMVVYQLGSVFKIGVDLL
jgi:ferrous iron transport protein B